MDNPLSKGTYAANYKLGDTPGKNTVTALGTVTASVPSLDASGNIIRTDKSLSAYYPMEIWGVKIANVPSYQAIILDAQGYLSADVIFPYKIDPLAYQSLVPDVSLLVYEKSSLGIESLMGLIQADSNRNLILNKGTAKFDEANTYYTQVVLNRGTSAEVRSEKVFLVRSALLIPDYNRDGRIDGADRERAAKGDKFYFWINDDDDQGETEGTDVPGAKRSYGGVDYMNYETSVVNGVRDLIDFFPVYLDIKDLLNAFDPGSYSYKLQSEDESLNFVLTNLEALNAGYYLRGDDNNLDIPLGLGSAVKFAVNKAGVLLIPTFLDGIKGGKKGVILLEGKKTSTRPLELAIYDSNQVRVISLTLNLSLSGVEQMFRHKNLSKVVNPDLAPGPGSIAGEIDRLEVPKNCPDVECTGINSINGKNFVFIHGYGNNGQEARGRQVEIFKRMFWSGSKAKFYGVTWYGWDSQLAGVTMNFHINVQHAFATVPALKDFLYNDVSGEVTIAAHSLGNMIVSAMLTDNAAGWDASKKSKTSL
ncbi:MAG: alpha/beta hydrolase family protein [Thermodesulfovibrionales bacterium]